MSVLGKRQWDAHDLAKLHDRALVTLRMSHRTWLVYGKEYGGHFLVYRMGRCIVQGCKRCPHCRSEVWFRDRQPAEEVRAFYVAQEMPYG